MIGWRQLIAIIGAGILLIGAGFGLAMLRQNTRPVPIEIVPPEATLAPTQVAAPTAAATTGLIHVYVSGAVARPAVYELPRLRVSRARGQITRLSRLLGRHGRRQTSHSGPIPRS